MDKSFVVGGGCGSGGGTDRLTVSIIGVEEEAPSEGNFGNAK